MKRARDWELKLAAYLEAVRASPFSWGGFDCCTFPCNAILAMTGVDIMAPLRGRYATEPEAMALLAATAIDLDGVAAQLTAASGMAEEGVLMAMRGDLVLADLRPRGVQFGPCLGLVGLAGRPLFAAAPGGYIEFPLRACRRAWRVS